MIKIIEKALLAWLMFFVASGVFVHAEANVNTTLCADKGVVFGFFNGVNTTLQQAKNARSKFEEIHGYKTENGDKIEYELFYNQTAAFEGFVEIFISGERNV